MINLTELRCRPVEIGRIALEDQRLFAPEINQA